MNTGSHGNYKRDPDLNPLTCCCLYGLMPAISRIIKVQDGRLGVHTLPGTLKPAGKDQQKRAK
jgi:hypothetical protein